MVRQARKWLGRDAEREVLLRLENELFPWLGSRPIAAIEASELLEALSGGNIEDARQKRGRPKSLLLRTSQPRSRLAGSFVRECKRPNAARDRGGAVHAQRWCSTELRGVPGAIRPSFSLICCSCSSSLFIFQYQSTTTLNMRKRTIQIAIATNGPTRSCTFDAPAI